MIYHTMSAFEIWVGRYFSIVPTLFDDQNLIYTYTMIKILGLLFRFPLFCPKVVKILQKIHRIL